MCVVLEKIRYIFLYFVTWNYNLVRLLTNFKVRGIFINRMRFNILLTSLSQSPFYVTRILIPIDIYVDFIVLMIWGESLAGCLLCWYILNYWPSLFQFYLHNDVLYHWENNHQVTLYRRHCATILKMVG